MLEGQKKHIDKEQGKTKHEAHRSVNYRATLNKNNIGTTALERSVVYTTPYTTPYHPQSDEAPDGFNDTQISLCQV